MPEVEAEEGVRAFRTHEPGPQHGSDMRHVKANVRRNVASLLRSSDLGYPGDVNLTRWDLTESGEGPPWGAELDWAAGDLTGGGQATIHHHDGHLELVTLEIWTRDT